MLKSVIDEYSKMNKKDKDLTKITQSIIANEIAVNYNHEIKFLPYYKHELKKSYNIFQKHLLNAHRKEYMLIYDVDEENTIKIQDAMMDTMTEMSTCMLFEFPNIYELIQAYKKSPSSIMGLAKKINK